MISKNIFLLASRLQICEIKLYNLPSIRTIGTLTYSIIASGSKVSIFNFFAIFRFCYHESPLQILSEQLSELKRVDNCVSIKLDRCLLLVGDIKIEFSCTQIIKHKQKLFHYWFNTFFVNEITKCKLSSRLCKSFTYPLFSSADPDGNVIFELEKGEIDDAHKDKQRMFSENFKVSRES